MVSTSENIDANSCAEINVQTPVMDAPRPGDKRDASVQTSSGLSGTPTKQLRTVSMQTSSHLSGPSQRGKRVTAKSETSARSSSAEKKSIASIKDLLVHLKKSGKSSDTLAETFLQKFKNFNLELFKNELNNNNTSKNCKSYTQEMKDFATTLYFYSPRGYDFVRSKLNLPHPATLRRWTGDYIIDAGFVENVFQFFKQESCSKNYLKDVALIFDSMAIRKQVLFDNKTEKCRGLVDYGSMNEQLKSEINLSAVATEALVFQIVSYRDQFKCPVANFFIAGTSATIQSQLLVETIKKLHEVGVTVRSLTCDGCSVNEKTLKLLGCNLDPQNLVTSFKHPCNESDIHVIMDPCHMIKLCRNTFGDKNLMSYSGEISFAYVAELHKIQEAEGMKLANRITNAHILYAQKKMKVSLATQTISCGVADAIDFLRAAGYVKFQGSEATCEFIRIFDRLFDMQNTRNCFGSGFKAPLSLRNVEFWEEVFKQSEQYILSLELENKPIIYHQRKLFAIGFLINIHSFRNLARDLLYKIDNPLKYLLTYKCSQDHIELHFCCLRSRGGWNNNPNVLQFLWSTRKLLFRNSVNPSRNANCVADNYDQTPIIEFRSSKRSNATIQPSDNFEEVTHLTDFMTSMQSTELTNLQQNILYYITGALIRKFLDKCDCSHCREILLYEEIENNAVLDHYHEVDVKRVSAFTTFVARGKLYSPSRAAYEITKFCEKIFIAEVAVSFTGVNNLRKRMTAAAVQHFIPLINVLFQPAHPIVDTHKLEDIHEIKLIEYLTGKYATLRIHTYLKNKSLQSLGNLSTMRQHLHNTILFYHI